VDSATQEQLRLSGVYKTLPSVFLYDVFLKNRDNFLNDKTKEELYTCQKLEVDLCQLSSTIYLIAEILKIEITYAFSSFKDIQCFQYSLFLHDSISGFE
jgi:hypothetical protein